MMSLADALSSCRRIIPKLTGNGRRSARLRANVTRQAVSDFVDLIKRFSQHHSHGNGGGEGITGADGVNEPGRAIAGMSAPLIWRIKGAPLLAARQCDQLELELIEQHLRSRSFIRRQREK